MHRQQIRPSLSDLQHLTDDEFDQSDELESEDDVPEFAPAATAIRGPPPSIVSRASIQTGETSNPQHKVTASSSSKHEAKLEADARLTSTPRKVVRIIAPSSTNQVHKIESQSNRTRRPISRFAASKELPESFENVPGPQSFRFNPDDAEEEEEEEEQDSSKTDRGRPEPLIGTIQERAGLGATLSKPVEKKSLSRFALSRKNEESRGNPTSTVEDASKSHDTTAEEEWLDEDGQPMSAFRRERLRRQGKAPPSSRTKEEPKKAALKVMSLNNENPSDPLSSLMSSVSQENEAKLSAMSVEEVEQDLAELQESFGVELLQKLKMRRQGREAMETTDIQTVKTSSPSVEVGRSNRVRQGMNIDGDQTTEEIREKFFPNEPESLPLSLKWTQSLEEEDSQATAENSFTLRFDFSGQVVSDGKLTDQETHLSGLHHHGKEQSRAGYSLEELLHLARSTQPSQRILALQTLDRVVSRYPDNSSFPSSKDGSIKSNVAKDLLDQSIRGKAAMIASWYVEDRQVSVRSTALRCLRSCLFTTKAGPIPTRGVVIEEDEKDVETDGQGKVTYSITSLQFSTALLPSLCNSLCQQGVTENDRQACLEMLVFLSSRSDEVCTTLIQRPACIESIVEGSILKKQWPVRKVEERPQALSLQLLLLLASSSRSNASSLIQRGCIDPLLRFLAIPPWFTTTEKVKKSYNIWIYFDLTLQVYAALATYGMYSDVLQKGYTVLPPILEWIRTFDVDVKEELNARLHALQSCLHCLDVWIVCAIDPHQTYGHHDIGWSQVAEWWECAVECGKRLTSSTPPSTDNLLAIMVAATESVSLLDNWLECATRNKQIIEERVKEEVFKGLEPLVMLIDLLCQTLSQHGNTISESFASPTECPNWKTVSTGLQQLADLCDGSRKVMKFVLGRSEFESVHDLARRQFLEAARALFRQPFWNVIDSSEARQAGVKGCRRPIIGFCCCAIEMSRAEKDESSLLDVLQVLSVLREGEEDWAVQMITTTLPTKCKQITKSDLFVLQPFITEMLRSKKSHNLVAPLHITSLSLSKTETLFVGSSSRNKEEEDVDPISGVDLWKSNAVGLPLRADWPLIALDDLLHSGNCASLNRRNALSSDWDANERQIVLSSLRVAVQLCRAAVDIEKDQKSRLFLPSSSELHLAIIKVFMLEEEQSQDPRMSGLITGRDLFRDGEIVKLLEGLFELAKKGIDHTTSNDNDDLELVSQRHFGTSLPFYQMYTSFIGLYDSISFGMELFGRALLLAQKGKYAIDYKRLLWIDYAPFLSTFSTKCNQSPYPTLSHFLTLDNIDESVLQAMMDALLRKSITKDRNELLYHIAIQQLGHSIWSSAKSERESKFAETLLSTAERDEQVLNAIKEYKPGCISLRAKGEREKGRKGE